MHIVTIFNVRGIFPSYESNATCVDYGGPESSMRTIWGHEKTREMCKWKELADAAWLAHDEKQPCQRESKKRIREGDTVEKELQRVVNADENEGNELTGRLEKLKAAYEKCAKSCSRVISLFDTARLESR